MVHACRSLSEEQAVEKGGGMGWARRQTAWQQLVQVERMARQTARSMERPLEMEMDEFWLMLVDRAASGADARTIQIASAD
jgi:hypothetical protein